jgi:hypothetical protein
LPAVSLQHHKKSLPAFADRDCAEKMTDGKGTWWPIKGLRNSVSVNQEIADTADENHCWNHPKNQDVHNSLRY